MYNKLFTKILDSSIWLESDTTRLVWLTVVAAMDEDGFAQFASPLNLAHRARVSPDACLEAIRCLESDDPHSGDPDNAGRRIERVDGGWIVLNAEKYRLMVTRTVARERTRDRVRKHRQLKRSEIGNADVTVSNDSVTQSEADTEANTDTTTTTLPPLGFQGRPLISGEASPKGWAKIHGDHVVGFCDWVCLPQFLHNEFVRKSSGADYVTTWAKGVRQAWQGQVIGDNLKFWRSRWSDTHPDKVSKPSKSRSVEDIKRSMGLLK